MSNRLDKLNSQFTRELSLYWQREFPDIFVSVTKLEIQNDLTKARVWLSFLNKQPGNLSSLKQSLPELRKNLKKHLNLKIIPNFELIEDTGMEYAEKISQTIKTW